MRSIPYKRFILFLFISFLSWAYNPAPSFASRTPALKEQSVTPKKKKKNKKRRKSKKKHHRSLEDSTPYIFSAIGLTLLILGTTLWLWGFFAKLFTIMFSGLLLLTGLAIVNFIDIILSVPIASALTIALLAIFSFVAGFVIGSLTLMIISMVLMLIGIAVATWIFLFILTY